MVLRTVIFIDGQNFRSSLRNFRFQSDPSVNPYRLEETHFNWTEFFKSVLNRFEETTSWEHRLVRVYWYYAQSISPWREHRRLAQSIVDRYRTSSNDLTLEEVVRLARQWYDRERRYFESRREDVFEDIQRNVNFLEFKYTGQYVVQPFTPHRIDQDLEGNITRYLGRQWGEKGVDTGIAVDMIAKMPYYDACILVSGDADFIPVVGYLKDNLKYVYQLSLAEGVPPSIRYLSPWLRGLVDCFEAFSELELLSEFLDRNSGIPQPILDSIDDRIADLQAMSS